MYREGWTDLRRSVRDRRGGAGVRDRIVVIVGNKLDTLLLHQVVLAQGGQGGQGVDLLLGGGGVVVVQGAGCVVLSQGVWQVLDLVVLALVVAEGSSGQLADVHTNLTGLQGLQGLEGGQLG